MDKIQIIFSAASKYHVNNRSLIHSYVKGCSPKFLLLSTRHSPARGRRRRWRRPSSRCEINSRASCNLQYRLKSIRLAFPTISRRARGYTWPARSARAIHPWRSPGWRTAGRWSRGRPLRIRSASSISRWGYRARRPRITATILAWRATMPPKRPAQRPSWSMVRSNRPSGRTPCRKPSLLPHSLHLPLCEEKFEATLHRPANWIPSISLSPKKFSPHLDLYSSLRLDWYLSNGTWT